MMKVKTQSGLKKVELMFLTAAIVFAPLGVDMVVEAAQASNMTSFLMGICITVLGLICGGVYIVIEKSTDDDEEEEPDTEEEE